MTVSAASGYGRQRGHSGVDRGADDQVDLVPQGRVEVIAHDEDVDELVDVIARAAQTGGYGRKDLLPGSDLDVLLLHDGRDGIARIADRIWYPVWDSGAHLDHAVRTVPQARRVARSDLKVALGLLYARHVAGDPDLTTRLRAGALEDWRSAAPTRLAELHASHDERARTRR